jgi:FkbH-like protein
MIGSSIEPPKALNSDISLGEALASIATADRRRIARRIARARGAILEDWTSRHQHYPILASHAVEALGSWEGYRTAYLAPLLFVLERAIRSGNPDYFHIYCAERTRFYDDARLANGGWYELEAILLGDRAGLLLHTAHHPRLASSVAALLNAVDAGLLRRKGHREVRIALVGDCLMTEIRAFLKPALIANGVSLKSHHFYFSARMGRDLSVVELESALTRERFDLLALSFFTFEGIPLYTSLIGEADGMSDAEITARCDGLLALVHDAVTRLRGATDATILLHGCSGLPLGRVRRYAPFLPAFSPGHARVAAALNSGLKEMAAATDNVLVLDEEAVVATVGPRRANRRFLPRRVTHTATFHYSAIGGLLASEYRELIETHLLLSRVKVLLIDFDNTLWSGVMAEGDVVHNLEAQVLLRELQRSGILLVAVSKNDPESIRWDEMALAPDDFVLHKIHWNPKPQSVAEAAHQLDLDPASFVFIDDNPVERELVASQLPTVTVMDGSDARTWERLRMMLSFPNTRRTDEAERRTAMYREAGRRREAVSGGVDYPAMMRSLRLRSEWRRAGRADVDRVHELVSRTNQFNTTTPRLGRPELAALLGASDQTIYVATLGDKFGELGIVGVVITRCTESRLIYDAVIMSCRAMGFGLESLLIRGPIDSANDVSTAVGRFTPTERNSPCAGLFREAGFEAAGDEWTLDLRGPLPHVPDWLTVVRG